MMNSKDKTLQRISRLKSIESKKLYTYELIHEYDIDKTPLIFSVHIAPSVISPLIAYIEFIYEENERTDWGIGKHTIVKIINEVYSTVDYETVNMSRYEIDQYYNREFWCGTELAVEYEPFIREESVSVIVDFVNEEIRLYNEKEAVASNI